MEIVLENSIWMVFNSSLALVAVSLGWLAFVVKQRFLRFILILLWILFLPNTIYILTDIKYLPEQLFQVPLHILPILLVQYTLFLILGVTTYIFSLYPLAHFFKKLFKRNMLALYSSLFMVNFTISYAIVLGRFYQIHSWYVFTDFVFVMRSTVSIISTKTYLPFMLLFTFTITFIYFVFHATTYNSVKKMLRYLS